jgi:hypothetical protein
MSTTQDPARGRSRRRSAELESSYHRSAARTPSPTASEMAALRGFAWKRPTLVDLRRLLNVRSASIDTWSELSIHRIFSLRLTPAQRNSSLSAWHSRFSLRFLSSKSISCAHSSPQRTGCTGTHGGFVLLYARTTAHNGTEPRADG